MAKKTVFDVTSNERMRASERERVCVCVCVRERERERKKERREIESVLINDKGMSGIHIT